MDKKEYKECLSHMDVAEVLIRAEKPKKLAKEGKIDDAIACAMAEGYRMGWEASKNKEEKNGSRVMSRCWQ